MQYTYWRISEEVLFLKSQEVLFLKNYTQNVVDKIFRDPFPKNRNWEHLWISSLNFIQFVFIICQVKEYRNVLKLTADHLLLFHVKLFSKRKRGMELVSLPHFLHDFWRKIFLLYSLTWPNFWLPLLDNTCIVIVY